MHSWYFCMSLQLHMSVFYCLHLCCESRRTNTDAKLQHTVHHPFRQNYTVCQSGSDVHTWLLAHMEMQFRPRFICSRLPMRMCSPSNVKSLNVYNTCKMAASSITFSVSIQSGSLGCCCRLWCLTSSCRTVRNKTRVMMMCPDFFLWCAGDVLGIEAPLGLFLRHTSFTTLRQSGHAPFSALGSKLLCFHEYQGAT